MAKSETELGGYAVAVTGMEEFGKALEGLLREMLRHNGVIVHTIDHRVKAEESAKRKIETADGDYTAYEDLHDLLGLRITCYFADEVERVAEIIDTQFRADPSKSEDKMDRLGPKEFGYRSVHRVAWLGDDRATLAEYSRFKDLRFEVQIRTVLQHAWAEIEHDLGYKAETIPGPMRRRFSMLAGVLELVDYEFQTLRKELDKYEEKAEKAANNSTTDMALDMATLYWLLRRDKLVRGLDRAVATTGKRRLGERPRDPRVLEQLLQKLNNLGISSISQLRETSEAWEPYVVAFVPHWLERSNNRRRERGESIPGGFPQGVGIYYLQFAMTLEAMRLGEEGNLSDDFLELKPLEIWEGIIAQFGGPPVL